LPGIFKKKQADFLPAFLEMYRIYSDLGSLGDPIWNFFFHAAICHLPWSAALSFRCLGGKKPAPQKMELPAGLPFRLLGPDHGAPFLWLQSFIRNLPRPLSFMKICRCTSNETGLFLLL